jgi:hypothetical protein
MVVVHGAPCGIPCRNSNIKQQMRLEKLVVTHLVEKFSVVYMEIQIEYYNVRQFEY